MKYLIISSIFVCFVLTDTYLTKNEMNNDIPQEPDDLLSRWSSFMHNLRDGTSFLGEQPLCKQCVHVVQKFIAARRTKSDKATMMNLLSKACEIAAGYPPSVCEKFTDIEIEIILFIIDNKKYLKPEEVCGIYFQHKGCTNPYAKDWTIEIPPKDVSVGKTSKRNLIGENSLKIVQITDVHYDPLYKAGNNANCGLPLCCEESSGVPNIPEDAAGLFGDRRSCDVPKTTLVNMLQEIKNTQKKIDFVYFTGDIIAHKNWETSRESNLQTIKEFYDFLSNYLGNITLYPILGNHEAHPCNLFAPRVVPRANVQSTQWLFDAVANYWSKWLPESALETIKLGGYYTVLVRPGFRIIALNSNVCFTENIWLMYDDEDPYKQLKWLVGILLEAEKNKEKVHILSHVPPGEVRCHRRWQYNFNRIVQRFANTISAQFNGHTHYDEFRIFKDEANSNQVINVAFNGGSFTTFTGLNPDYRVYDIDQQNLMVLDYDQYTFNLTLANMQPQKGPQWYKLYSFKSAYGLDDLSYESLLKLNNKVLSDSKLAQQYVKYFVRESDFGFENGCNKTCIQSQVCHISAIDADESLKCGEYTWV